MPDGQISDEQLVQISSELPDLASVATIIINMIREAYVMGHTDGQAELRAEAQAIINTGDGG